MSKHYDLSSILKQRVSIFHTIVLKTDIIYSQSYGRIPLRANEYRVSFHALHACNARIVPFLLCLPLPLRQVCPTFQPPLVVSCTFGTSLLVLLKYTLLSNCFSPFNVSKMLNSITCGTKTKTRRNLFLAADRKGFQQYFFSKQLL